MNGYIRPFIRVTDPIEEIMWISITLSVVILQSVLVISFSLMCKCLATPKRANIL